MSISDKFQTLLSNIRTNNDASISQRYRAITKRLNKDYYGSESDINHSRYVGSYGRGTSIRGVSDIDMVFQLPYTTYERFNKYSSNGQSALLQEVKNSITTTYHSTNIGGDGQVVVVNFSDMVFEVVPVFINDNGSSYTYPDSNNGGKWKTCNPISEYLAINKANDKYKNKIKHLTRMIKVWRNVNDVAITGFLIETLVMQFMDSWEYNDKSYLYYDFMTRDFLKFLSERDKNQKHWLARGSGQYIYRTGSFENKAKISYEKTKEAIADEEKYPSLARSAWQEIFGKSYVG